MTATPGLRRVASLALCVGLAACSSKADRIESGLRKGAEYVGQSEWDKASVEVRNVLQIDPKTARAYLIAGRIDDHRGALRSAYANYSKAVELQPDLLDAKIGLGRLYLLVGDLDAAEKVITDISSTAPADARGRTLRVSLLARRGHSDEALAEARRIVDSGERLPVDSSLMLAGLYVNAKDDETALRILDRASAGAEKDVRPLQMAGEVAAARASDASFATRADGYYRAATAQAPRDDDLWRRWALVHIRRQEIPAAEAVLRDAIRAQPDNVARVLALLDFSAAFKGAAETEREFATAIGARPKDAALRFALVRYDDAMNRPDDARRVLGEIVASGKDTPDGLSARGQIAARDLAAGKVDLARSELDAILKANPRDGTGLLLRGRILLAEGKARDAIIDLRSAAKDQPGSADVVALLAQAHAAAGEPQLAREVLVDAVKFKRDDPRLHLLLASDMASAGDVEAAQAEVDEAIKLAPRNSRAYELKGQIALKAGDAAKVEQAALALEEQLPKSPDAALLRARLLASQKHYDAALKQYDLAAALAPANPAPAISATSLLIGQRRFKEADARIAALVAAKPSSALAQELRGESALAQGALPAAEESFKAVLSLAPTPDAYRNLAAVLVARNNLAAALGVLDDGERAHPNDAMLPSAHAEWLGRAGRLDDAIGVYEAALKRLPDNEMLANNLAFILAETKSDKASLARAQQLSTRLATSNQPDHLDTVGMVRYRLGEYDQAALALEHAVALAPSDPQLQMHLGMALYKRGDTERGKELLKKALTAKSGLANTAEARALVARG